MTKRIIRSDEECQKILALMNLAGERAARAYMQDHEDTGAVGFAEVRIPKEEHSLRHAYGSPFQRYLMPRGGVSSAMVWCGNYQSLDAHDAAAKAMAESLRGNGVDATYRSWMD